MLHLEFPEGLCKSRIEQNFYDMLVNAICKASRASVIPCKLTRQHISRLERFSWVTPLRAIPNNPRVRTTNVAMAKKPIK